MHWECFITKIWECRQALRNNVQLPELSPRRRNICDKVYRSKRLMQNKLKILDAYCTKWGIIDVGERTTIGWYFGGIKDPDPTALADMLTQCAEDNALMHLKEWLDKNPNLPNTQLTWYVAEKRGQNSEMSPVQLCPVCHVAFEKRIETIIISS